MKNRIICLLLVLIMCFSVFALTACNNDTPDTPDNGNDNGDNGNTGNGGTNGDGGNSNDDTPTTRPPWIDTEESEEGWWEEITYNPTTLRFQMTNCTNNQELPSGCERYLAGESADHEDIDELIQERNDDAKSLTCITEINYAYYDDVASEYGYSKNINRIYQEVSNKSQNTPDMYCNFMTDML